MLDLNIILIQLFRLIILLEGLSYLLLLFIAVPIKYYGNDEFYVKLLGMPHGLLFMSYVVFAIIFREKFNWSSKSFLIILSASVIPLGTFYIDKKYLRNNNL